MPRTLMEGDLSDLVSDWMVDKEETLSVGWDSCTVMETACLPALPWQARALAV